MAVTIPLALSLLFLLFGQPLAASVAEIICNQMQVATAYAAAQFNHSVVCDPLCYCQLYRGEYHRWSDNDRMNSRDSRDNEGRSNNNNNGLNSPKNSVHFNNNSNANSNDNSLDYNKTSWTTGVIPLPISISLRRYHNCHYCGSSSSSSSSSLSNARTTTVSITMSDQTMAEAIEAVINSLKVVHSITVVYDKAHLNVVELLQVSKFAVIDVKRWRIGLPFYWTVDGAGRQIEPYSTTLLLLDYDIAREFFRQSQQSSVLWILSPAAFSAYRFQPSTKQTLNIIGIQSAQSDDSPIYSRLLCDFQALWSAALGEQRS